VPHECQNHGDYKNLVGIDNPVDANHTVLLTVLLLM
jgi:hypothetical protein